MRSIVGAVAYGHVSPAKVAELIRNAVGGGVWIQAVQKSLP